MLNLFFGWSALPLCHRLLIHIVKRIANLLHVMLLLGGWVGVRTCVRVCVCVCVCVCDMILKQNVLSFFSVRTASVKTANVSIPSHPVCGNKIEMGKQGQK